VIRLTRASHHLVRLARKDRVWRRMLGDETRRARASGEKARAALGGREACPWPCRRAGARVALSVSLMTPATSASGIAARQGRDVAYAAARRGTRKSPTAFGGDAQTDPIQRQPLQSLRQFSICKRPVKTALQGAKPSRHARSGYCRSVGQTERPASDVSQALSACGTKISSTLRPSAVRRINTTTSTACLIVRIGAAAATSAIKSSSR
jgi:hypothetical protein